jgi:hypothetical protein
VVDVTGANAMGAFCDAVHREAERRRARQHATDAQRNMSMGELPDTAATRWLEALEREGVARNIGKGLATEVVARLDAHARVEANIEAFVRDDKAHAYMA